MLTRVLKITTAFLVIKASNCLAKDPNNVLLQLEIHIVDNSTVIYQKIMMCKKPRHSDDRNLIFCVKNIGNGSVRVRLLLAEKQVIDNQ